MDRRQFLKSTGFALSATALAGVPGRAQAAPIKVGVLAPLTGVVASGGREMVEGTQFWFDQIGNQLSGRKVELAIEDDASNPDVALQKARRLVEQSNVHFLIGNLLANTGLAVANYVKGTGTPYFIPIIAADDLTQRQRIRNVIRVAGYSASAFTHPFDAFLDTVLKTDLPDSPLGKPVRLDAYGNPIYDVYVRKVVKRPDGKYWNVPIESYPNVSQFWKYDPETYLKQPPYSRSFQGIKKT
jgi:hypothetical protein